MTDALGLASIAVKLALYMGVLTSAGTVFCIVVFRGHGSGGFAVRFAVLGVMATVLGFMLRGAALTGDAAGMTDPEMLGLLWSTPVGDAFSYRLAGLALLIIGVLFGPRGRWLAVIGAGLAVWSLAMIGHVAAREQVLLQALLVFHLAAVAFWIGVLAPLRRLARNADSLAEAARFGHRFGRVAVGVVPLLILAGGVMSYALVGSVSALLTTGYGQVLIAKVALVAGLLGLAMLNKTRFVPGMMAGDAQAGARLAMSISIECWMIGAILLATAVLTSVLVVPT